MSKLLRYDQKVFGSTAQAGQISKFGSLQAGVPETYSGATVTPDNIQALSNYLTGWFGSIMANNSPTVEDFNAICYLFTYQVAYLCQRGVPEWCAGTTYYTGSVVTDSSGNMYKSLIDNNLNQSILDLTKWRPYNFQTATAALNIANSPYTVTLSDSNQILMIDSSLGNMTIQLPSPAASANLYFTIKDVGGYSATAPITIKRYSAEKIEGLASDYTCEANYGTWKIVCDGTNWWLC